jgi:hypothetical protein
MDYLGAERHARFPTRQLIKAGRTSCLSCSITDEIVVYEEDIPRQPNAYRRFQLSG